MYIGEYKEESYGEVLQIEELDEPDQHEEAKPNDGDMVTLIIQWLLLTPLKELHPMRHAIFKTRCTIASKVCDLIVDTGSSDNIVSNAIVKALKLPT